MDSTEANAMIQRATTNLSIGRTPQCDLEHAANIFKIHGIHSRIWDEAVQTIGAEQNTQRKKATIARIVMVYEDICDKRLTVECSHCSQSGMVLCLTIAGTYKNRFKQFIFDPVKPGQEKHLNFLYSMKKQESPFYPELKFLPCICENGDKRNQRFGDPWTSEKVRQRAIERTFRGPNAEFDAQNWHDWIYDTARGVKPKWQTWLDKPKPTKEQINQLKKGGV